MKCDFDPSQMMQPPKPGGPGMSITISIDLGSLMNPCLPQDMQGCMPAPICPPSTSLTKMQKPPVPECKPGKVASFLDKKEDKKDQEEECEE